MALVWTAVLAVAGITLASFGGVFSDLLEILSHLRIQILGLSVAVALLTTWRGTRRIQAAALALCLLNAWPLAQHTARSAPRAADTAGSMEITVLGANLHSRNVNADALLDLFRAVNPDVAVLTEVDPETESRLRNLMPSFDWAWAGTQNGSFSTLIARRGETLPPPIVVNAVDGYNFPVSRFEFCAHKCVRIIALHAARPSGITAADWQERQFTVVSDLADETQVDILVGDLNTTPWSPRFARLSDRAGLKDAAPGIGWANTWLSSIPGMGFRIDHILAGSEMSVASYEVGPDIGSDHRPVVARLVAGD